MKYEVHVVAWDNSSVVIHRTNNKAEAIQRAKAAASYNEAVSEVWSREGVLTFTTDKGNQQ